ncbi:propionyl-CoA synthetase [Hyphomicrobium methylovorum]|uniref:propionyl-CoA synthetase n=1 Tax=Hyphomicrobium methylovorum TaxID=84 RepID=UPI0015E6389F|nr:propionyl-CoA synthetase [Hyphomicrobium methylovorum]MBA2124952.1 propionyl-CoA synthetase [Hyphomicrobium methylovorum]
MTAYRDVYNAWLADPEGFWAEQAKSIDWFKQPERTFDSTIAPYGRWFIGGETNTAYNCLDRHVGAGRGDQLAIIYDSPVTGTRRTLTYAQLLDDVEVFAAALAGLGITKGDRVLIYMPMVPEVAIAMLAVARLGAIHSVVFGGFAANEVAIRLNEAKPKVVISASCGVEPKHVVKYKPLLDAAIELAAHKPEYCIVLQREVETATLHEGRDLDWATLVDKTRKAGGKAACVPVQATDPLYILYTSGSTGQPKGVVRDTGGMVALAWSMRNVYGVEPGEVFWSASDVGWVVGHSYIIYGPLLNGNTTIIYEGKPVGTPDAGAFWRVISQYKVAALFTAPTAIRAIKKEDPYGALIGKYDMSSLRTLFLAGERADPATIAWAEHYLDVPVIDNWWQTETGWPIVANPIGLGALPVKPGSPTVPMPGYDVRILDDAGTEVEAGQLGNIVIKMPLPPGCFPTLWGAEDRFGKTYTDDFPGHYKTSDAGYRDEDGYIFIMGRTDDIINVAGHRLSTGAMEEVLSSHRDVAECAVVGAADALKGELPVGFVVLKAGVSRAASEIEDEVVALVRERIGPVAAFKSVRTIARLPKTRSGKILRGTIRKIVEGADYKMPPTIDDPAILSEIEAVLVERPLAG